MTTTTCGTCGRPLGEDPNTLENIVPCAFCDDLFCSDACLADHQVDRHPEEALPPPEEEEELA